MRHIHVLSKNSLHESNFYSDQGSVIFDRTEQQSSHLIRIHCIHPTSSSINMALFLSIHSRAYTQQKFLVLIQPLFKLRRNYSPINGMSAEIVLAECLWEMFRRSVLDSLKPFGYSQFKSDANRSWAYWVECYAYMYFAQPKHCLNLNILESTYTTLRFFNRASDIDNLPNLY